MAAVRVQVASVDQSVAKAKRLGAEIHVPSDPQGAMLGLLQPEQKK